MSKSLQDQLRALGLAGNKPEKQRQAKTRKPGNARQQSVAAGGRKPAEPSLAKAFELKKRDEQKQADHARRQKQAQDRQRRLLNNEVRAIVRHHRLNREDAEIARNFFFRGRIRKIHVTAEQLKALNSGGMGIAYLSGGYHLLADEHVQAVRRLSAEHVVDLDSGTTDDGDHPVPDDITW